MIYAIANRKGGVGKSTTAAAMLAGLTLKGYKALAIDLDAQQNLSYSIGAETGGKTALGVLMGEITAAEAIQHTSSGDIIAASQALGGIEAIVGDTGKEYRIKEALEPVKESYDFIILDTPPSLGLITVASLTAADRVIIPAKADAFSLQGIQELNATMKPVKKYCNPGLKVEGVLLTQYSPRSIISRDIAKLMGQLAESIGGRLFNTTIRESVSVRESQMVGENLFKYAPKAKVTADYAAFINELLQEV